MMFPANVLVPVVLVAVIYPTTGDAVAVTVVGDDHTVSNPVVPPAIDAPPPTIQVLPSFEKHGETMVPENFEVAVLVAVRYPTTGEVVAPTVVAEDQYVSAPAEPPDKPAPPVMQVEPSTVKHDALTGPENEDVAVEVEVNDDVMILPEKYPLPTTSKALVGEDVPMPTFKAFVPVPPMIKAFDAPIKELLPSAILFE